MASSWAAMMREARAQYAAETAGEATDAERMRAGVAPVAGPSDRRRAAVQALVAGGATEGERSAAQAAMERLDAAAQGHSALMGRLDNEAESFGAYE